MPRPATKAVIQTVDGSLKVESHFDPYEYKISRTNNYMGSSQENGNTPANGSLPPQEFSSAGRQSMTITLLFDTYEARSNVTEVTNKLWKMMDPTVEVSTKTQGETKLVPPVVEFRWGGLVFESVITSIDQTYTLFLPDGTPVRAKAVVSFKQHGDPSTLPHQNPTSGGGPVERVWEVQRGDRLDSIAYAVYGDATEWQAIARHNRIRAPLRLRPGQTLAIPELI